MEITPESLGEQIPYYLTQEQKNGLVKALKDFPEKTEYYLNSYQEDLLQGDGWSKLQIRNFETGEKISSLGIVLSNTCDVDPQNQRDLPVKITFAPIVPLAAYRSLLERAGVEPQRINDKVKSIQEQKVTNIFFLPSGGNMKEDHIALLDEIHTMPANFFALEKDKLKYFSLSMVGFYLFLLKLSVHFCRFNEKLSRA